MQVEVGSKEGGGQERSLILGIIFKDNSVQQKNGVVDGNMGMERVADLLPESTIHKLHPKERTKGYRRIKNF